MSEGKPRKVLLWPCARKGPHRVALRQAGMVSVSVHTIQYSVATAIAMAGFSVANAEELPERPDAATTTVLKAPELHAIELPVRVEVAKSIGAVSSQPVMRVTISRAQSVGTVAIDSGEGGAQLTTVAGPELLAQVAVAELLPGAQVTASRDSDFVGRPMDIFRPIYLGGNGSIAFPSRMPVASGRLSSRFGMRNHPILGGYRMHSGVDLAAPYGSPIVSTTDGVVGAAGWNGGYGLSVSVVNGGMETRYGHMSRVNVAAGQRVRQGDVIGYVGSTGRSTGPHLHYEVRANGRALDPLRARAK